MSSLIMSSSLFPSVDLRTLNIICIIKSFFEKSFHDQQMAASGCFYYVLPECRAIFMRHLAN